MRFPNSVLEEIKMRLPVSQVVGRRVRLQKRGREYVGLSPFKNEKTPSFTVNDQKQFYHCFSSGEHGDVFKFLMVTEGLSFAEAVEQLAEEAGVDLPKPSPAVVQQEAENDRLQRVVETSQAFFRAQLVAPAGREVRDYIAGRGLSGEIVETFGIGFAPDGRTALRGHLKEAGFSDQDMARAGMVIAGQDIREPYDRFRNRLMFPIRNLGGRTIAFGGRALSADQRAKYLNSPETPLFHKGAVLFNGDQARRAAHMSGEVVVAEGYMDVIALHRAGITHAVAPLGTALTEDQLRLLWPMAPKVVLCFDGDDAGQRAAQRALDLALPHLVPERTLRFAFMPDGMDPDDVLTTWGAGYVRRSIAQAKVTSEFMWDTANKMYGGATEEHYALLKNTVSSRIERIQDATLRNEYLNGMHKRLRDTRRSAAPIKSNPEHAWRNGPVPTVRRRVGESAVQSAYRMDQTNKHGTQKSSGLMGSNLVADEGLVMGASEALILLTAINHPWLLDDYSEHLAEMRFRSPQMGALRDAILARDAESDALDTVGLKDHLVQLGQTASLASIERLTAHEATGFSHPETPRESVIAGWNECLVARECEALDEAIEEARQEAERSGDSEAYDQLMALRDERERLSLRTA